MQQDQAEQPVEEAKAASNDVDQMTELPGQNHDTQINAETPMTLASDPLGAGANPRVHSGMELPLNRLDEVNESAAMLAT